MVVDHEVVCLDVIVDEVILAKATEHLEEEGLQCDGVI